MSTKKGITRAQLQEMLDAGLSRKAMAAQLETSVAQLKRLLKQAGMQKLRAKKNDYELIEEQPNQAIEQSV